MRTYGQEKDSMYMSPVAENPSYPYQYYKISQLMIHSDTLKDVRFSLIPKKDDTHGKAKTKIYLNSLNIEKDLTDEKVRKKMTRVYKRMLKNILIEWTGSKFC